MRLGWHSINAVDYLSSSHVNFTSNVSFHSFNSYIYQNVWCILTNIDMQTWQIVAKGLRTSLFFTQFTLQE